MKTINLPEGNAFGVDDDDSGTPIVDYAEHRAKTLFFVWVTLTEHKWVILGERRGKTLTSSPHRGPRGETPHEVGTATNRSNPSLGDHLKTGP